MAIQAKAVAAVLSSPKTKKAIRNILIGVLCIALLFGGGFGLDIMQNEIPKYFQKHIQDIFIKNKDDSSQPLDASLIYATYFTLFYKNAKTSDDEHKKTAKRLLLCFLNEIKKEQQIATGDKGKTEIVTKYSFITDFDTVIKNISKEFGITVSDREKKLILDYKEMMFSYSSSVPGAGGDIVKLLEAEYNSYVSSGSYGGSKYVSWYNQKYGTSFSGFVHWCAIFVSWAGDQCGYVDTGIMYASAGAGNHPREFYAARGQWHSRAREPGYIPQPGDVILFRWDPSGYYSGYDEYYSDHIGFVVEVKDGYIYTIEGNASDQIKRLAYPINSSVINGFCSPAYN